MSGRSGGAPLELGNIDDVARPRRRWLANIKSAVLPVYLCRLAYRSRRNPLREPARYSRTTAMGTKTETLIEAALRHGL